MPTFDPTELARYGGLTMLARGIVEGALAGIHRSPFKGFSVEFAEHRPYSPGDEVRRIDWRTYGKTDRYYVKEFEDETNLTAYVVVDSSGSMRYRGRAELSKFEVARRVAASLSYLLLAQLDAVGLIVHDTVIRQLIPPKASSKQLLGLLRALESATPGGETGLAEVWDAVATRHLTRRGLVVLISDGFDGVARLRSALRHLRHRGHDILFVQVLAREEVDFPFTKATKFRDYESPTRVVAVDAARETYRRNFAAWEDGLRKALADVKADRIVLRTDEPIDRALGDYLARRSAGR
jgi:uncharacterized protein (DUF58 family)